MSRSPESETSRLRDALAPEYAPRSWIVLTGTPLDAGFWHASIEANLGAAANGHGRPFVRIVISPAREKSEHDDMARRLTRDVILSGVVPVVDGMSTTADGDGVIALRRLLGEL